MSTIIKTEGIVLSIVKFSDSSKIAKIFSEDFGKLSVIIKGARSKNSPMGKIIDPLNHIEFIYSQKAAREVQTLTSADLINHFPAVKNDYSSLKYSLAVIELIDMLMLEGEANQRLFKGTRRILERMEEKSEFPFSNFLRFFIFFLTELGYDIQTDHCTHCGKPFADFPLLFSYTKGLSCKDCSESIHAGTEINRELFEILICLKYGKNVPNKKESLLEFWHQIINRYTEFHIPNFKKLNSLQL